MTDYTTIQLPQWKDWRIAGTKLDWQMQEVRSHGKRGDEWQPVRYYPHLEQALQAAYDRSLKESGKKFNSIKELRKECFKAKEELKEASEWARVTTK